jgi:hemerythrin
LLRESPLLRYVLFCEDEMLEWSEKFLVGHERIDFEHKIFFGLIRDFQTARGHAASARELEDILEEIVLYAKFHFRSEENLMAKFGYPDLPAHRDLHWRLIDLLHAKIMAFQVKTLTALGIENFLIEWFLQHTGQEDVKFVAYCRAGMAPAARSRVENAPTAETAGALHKPDQGD